MRVGLWSARITAPVKRHKKARFLWVHDLSTAMCGLWKMAALCKPEAVSESAPSRFDLELPSTQLRVVLAPWSKCVATAAGADPDPTVSFRADCNPPTSVSGHHIQTFCSSSTDVFITCFQVMEEWGTSPGSSWALECEWADHYKHLPLCSVCPGILEPATMTYTLVSDSWGMQIMEEGSLPTHHQTADSAKHPNSINLNFQIYHFALNFSSSI